MNLKEYMDTHEVNNTDVAKAVGVHRSVIWKIAAGEVRMSAEMAVKLSKVYGGSAWDWYEEQARKDILNAGGINE